MPAARATVPIAATGLTRPPLVGTCVVAISFTHSSTSSRSAATETWPNSSFGTVTTSTPTRCATWR
jgi:hypothetical protein